MVKQRYKKKGSRQQHGGFRAVVRAANQAYRGETDQRLAIIKAMRAARRRITPKTKASFRKRARIIPVPKRGGFLPALFAGLAALGSILGGASAVVKTVKAAKEAREQLKESERHNRTMEAIALRGKGVNMKLGPYKKGLGLYLDPTKNVY